MRHVCFTVMAVLVISAGCSKDNGKTGPENMAGTFVLEYYSGAECSGTIESDGSWVINNNELQWCSVSPLSGDAGVTTITLTSTSLNEGLKERMGVLSIEGQAGTDSYYVIQRGSPGITLLSDQYVLMAHDTELRIPVEGNMTLTEDMISSIPEWVGFEGFSVSDSTLLDDGVTVSEYVTTEMIFSVEEHSGTEAREGKVVLNVMDEEYELALLQMMPVSADFSRRFYRNSAMIRFTGVYCGYCPWMSEGLERAKEQVPDRIVSINFHAKSYSDPKYNLVWEGSREVEDFYRVPSYPYANFNNIAQVQNAAPDVLADVISELALEAEKYYPSESGIMAVSRCSENGDISLNVIVASEAEEDFSMSVWILEDGLQYPQTGASEDYVHDYVVRGTLSEDFIGGDAIPVFEDGMSVAHLNGELPSSVEDRRNAYLVIVVMRPGAPDTQSVTLAKYGDYGSIIDNVAVCPLNGMVDFRYE